MRQPSFLLFLFLFSIVTKVQAEEIGTFKIEAQKTETFSYNSTAGQVFEFKILHGPELPNGQKGFEFGSDKQAVFCEGKNCARSGGYLLFCPKGGVITGQMKNFSQFNFEISVQRVECEGKEATSMKCPRASTVQAMCR